MALLQLVDDISSELDTKNNFIGEFIDLSNAFDTIDQKLLIKKTLSLWYTRSCLKLVY